MPPTLPIYLQPGGKTEKEYRAMVLVAKYLGEASVSAYVRVSRLPGGGRLAHTVVGYIYPKA
jgi:hypothetical protein